MSQVPGVDSTNDLLGQAVMRVQRCRELCSTQMDWGRNPFSIYYIPVLTSWPEPCPVHPVYCVFHKGQRTHPVGLKLFSPSLAGFTVQEEQAVA